LTPRVKPVAGADASGPALGFLEPCLVVAEQHTEGAGPGTEWLYVARQSAPSAPWVAAGWVERRRVIAAPNAEIDPQTRTPRKRLIVNTVLSLQTPGSEEFVEVPVRRSLGKDAPRSGTARMLDLFFQYAAIDGFVLVGPEPRFDPNANNGWPGKAVAGWIPEEVTIPFNGQFAASWDRGSTLPGTRDRRPPTGRIFRSHRDAYDSLQISRPALFEEQADEDKASLELPPSAPRMPVLPFVDNKDFPEFDPLTNNQLVRLAGLGALLAPGDGPPTRAEADQARRELVSLRGQLNATVQILIVIDDTMSMGPHFPRVAQSVRRIIEDATRNPEQTVEVAVSYYNDVLPGQVGPGYFSRRLVDARSPECSVMLQEVDAHGKALHHGGDFPEMVSEGLAHALDEANFEARPNAHRLVIDIGDHGNRGDPDYDGLIGKLTLPGRGPIQLAVFQVVDPERVPVEYPAELWSKAQAAARAFRDQMTELVNRLKRRSAGEAGQDSSFAIVKDEGARLSVEINQKYDRMKERERDLKKKLARLEVRNFPTKAGPEMEELLKARGVPVERLQELVGVRVGQEGYVWHWFRPPVSGAGVAQIRLETLLSRAEARKLADLITPLLGSPDPLGELRRAVGKDQSLSYERAVLTPLGLPAKAFCLRRSVESLTNELVQAELPAASERLQRLRSLCDGNGSGSRWFLLPEGTSEWCWADVEIEIP